jgi:epsilon-lactone hydrolase
MHQWIDAFRDRQRASANEARPSLGGWRAGFAPAGRIYPVPDDVVVNDVNAGGVPAHWLAAPQVKADQVILFFHGGGHELGSLRGDGELAARLGRASGMRVLFCEYRLGPRASLPCGHR